MDYKIFTQFSYSLFLYKINKADNNKQIKNIKYTDKRNSLDKLVKNLNIVEYPILEAFIRLKNYQISNNGEDIIKKLETEEILITEKIINMDRSLIFRYLKR